jgi:predicted dehydrogenase
MIGTRGHQNTVLRELPNLPDVRVVGVAHGGSGDTCDPLVAWCRQNGHDAADFGDRWLAMLDELRPDAVVVAGPFELHATMCAAAVERGIHVLTEKTAALTHADLDALAAACRAHPDVHLAGMMFARYMPGFYTASRLIADGAIGEVRLIEARKSYKMGRRAAFYRRRETYGGTIPWVGSHAIDWVMWYAGESAFRSVYATHSALPAGEHGAMETTALCHFALGDRGLAASVAIDVMRPDTAATHGDDWARVVGTGGVLEVRPTHLRLINGKDYGDAGVPVACDRKPFADFVAHAEGRGTALVTVDDTLRLTEACLRARDSADQGRAVAFPARARLPLHREVVDGGAVAAR